MTTFTWTITSLYTIPQVGDATNVVVSATYFLIAKRDSYLVSHHDSIKFVYTNGEFIKFADLTEDDILKWVFNILGDDMIAEMKQDLEDQINSIINPIVNPTKQILPWTIVSNN